MEPSASSSIKLDTFTALVSGDFDAVKNLPAELDMKGYFTIGILIIHFYA